MSLNSSGLFWPLIGLVAVFLIIIIVASIFVRRTGGDFEREVEDLKKFSEKHRKMKAELNNANRKNELLKELLSLDEADRNELLKQLENQKKD